MTGRPQGLSCPGCGEPAAVSLGGQAWCASDGCAVWCWDPRKTLEQLAADIGQVRITGDGGELDGAEDP